MSSRTLSERILWGILGITTLANLSVLQSAREAGVHARIRANVSCTLMETAIPSAIIRVQQSRLPSQRSH